MKDTVIKYEVVTVLRPKAENKEKVIEQVEGWLEKNGAKIISKDNEGMKDLAYAIDGERRGDFWVFLVETPKALQLNEFNLFLNRESSIIRYLILKNPAVVKAKAGK